MEPHIISKHESGRSSHKGGYPNAERQLDSCSGPGGGGQKESMLVNPSRLPNAGSFSMGAVPRFWFCSIESEHPYGAKGVPPRYATLVQSVVICTNPQMLMLPRYYNVVGVVFISSTLLRHLHNVLRQCFIFCRKFFQSENSVSWLQVFGVAAVSLWSTCMRSLFNASGQFVSAPTAAGRPVIWDKWLHYRGIGAHLPARWL